MINYYSASPPHSHSTYMSRSHHAQHAARLAPVMETSSHRRCSSRYDIPGLHRPGTLDRVEGGCTVLL